MQEARWLEATCILLQDSSIDSGEAKGRLKAGCGQNCPPHKISGENRFASATK
jgi:hypothetical protein